MTSGSTVLIFTILRVILFDFFTYALLSCLDKTVPPCLTCLSPLKSIQTFLSSFYCQLFQNRQNHQMCLSRATLQIEALKNVLKHKKKKQLQLSLNSFNFQGLLLMKIHMFVILHQMIVLNQSHQLNQLFLGNIPKKFFKISSKWVHDNGIEQRYQHNPTLVGQMSGVDLLFLYFLQN